MNPSDEIPHVTSEGVNFHLEFDSEEIDCTVSIEALARLCELRGVDAEPIETFYAFEMTIKDAARRLAADSTASPIMLSANEFPAHRWPGSHVQAVDKHA